MSESQRLATLILPANMIFALLRRAERAGWLDYRFGGVMNPDCGALPDDTQLVWVTGRGSANSVGLVVASESLPVPKCYPGMPPPEYEVALVSEPLLLPKHEEAIV